ncbi:MAG TPA: nitroreductase/quinone reductase family protein [Solirubrobacterales bacterium]
MPSDRFYAKLSRSLGVRGLRLWGKLNVPVYRASGGRVGGKMGRAPVLLLTTTGRKSGEKRTTPVVYLEDDGRFSVINTNAANRIPSWSRNLDANPEAEVEVGRLRMAVRARPAEGEERAELWRKHNAQYSGFDEYKAILPDDRPITVYVLEPRQ